MILKCFNMENNVYEWCPQCEEEVVLTNEFKVQICPNCGSPIVPCSICPLLANGKCPSDCTLNEEANLMGKEKNI